MSSNIKHIEITFSNTEQIKIPAEYVGSLIFTDHENMFTRVAVNYFLDIDIYNLVYFNINREFSKNTKISSHFGEALNDDLTPDERLYKFEDITHIDVVYDEEYDINPKRYTVAWDVHSDFIHEVNPLQSTRVNDAGDLEILIATKESINKHKDMIETEQKEFLDIDKMNNRWKMFS